MRITLGNTLPPYPDFVEGIRRAPDRGYTLTPAQTITALKNALRYIPTEWHEQLAPELMEEPSNICDTYSTCTAWRIFLFFKECATRLC